MLACRPAGQTAVAHAGGTTPAMAQAARDWLDVLSPELRSQAWFAFTDAERVNWHFYPNKNQRKGVSIGALDAVQREKAMALLETALSDEGLHKARQIMHLESVLHALEQRQAGDRHRNPEDYYVSVFGEPGVDSLWGWRFEGHHISLNFTGVAAQGLAVTPSLLGTNPAIVRSGPDSGLEVLRDEQTLGRALVQSLRPEQLAQAMLPIEAPHELLTFVERRVMLQREGIPATALDSAQRAGLRALIAVYTGRMRPEIATAQWARIDAHGGIDSIWFAWAGGLAPGDPHYYRIHGPSLLVEYDNTQDKANHVHAVWRDPENDFGDDLLRRHYEQDHQH
ncbi:MAG: DUF3500 domain-containing protein [Bacteroidia bacterium]